LIGTLLLWFAWYGFNCGSTLSATNPYGHLIGIVGVNTTMGSVSGGFMMFLIGIYRKDIPKD